MNSVLLYWDTRENTINQTKFISRRHIIDCVRSKGHIYEALKVDSSMVFIRDTRLLSDARQLLLNTQTLTHEAVAENQCLFCSKQQKLNHKRLNPWLNHLQIIKERQLEFFFLKILKIWKLLKIDLSLSIGLRNLTYK